MGFSLSKNELIRTLGYSFGMYEGKPVYLSVSQQELYATPMGPDSVQSFVIDHTNPTFTISNVRAGFIQFDRNCWYIVPHSSIGMGIQSFTAKWSSTQNAKLPYNLCTHNSIELYNCIMGRHMSFKDAIKHLDAGVLNGAAFHRDYALCRVRSRDDYDLIYKTRNIGICEHTTGKFTIFKSPLTKLFVSKLKELACQ